MRRELGSDQAIAGLAGRQHGVVTRSQLLAFGLSPSAIDRRVRAGRLHRLHRGVHAVGHRAMTIEGRWLAAILAAGAGAMLSHHAAAALWELRRHGPGPIDVTVPTAAGRRAPTGVRLHRRAAIRPDEVVTRRRIPVTTPARTLFDLAAVLARRSLERAVDQAAVLRLCGSDAVRAVVDAHIGESGAPALAAVLDEHLAGSTLTRSELEERFLALCATRRIARPRVNARVAGLEVDFHWPSRGLVVEVDGFAYHGTRAAFERDRARDARLAAAGARVLRFTYRQVTREPAAVARAVRRSLSS